MKQCILLIIFCANSAISYDGINLITNKFQNIRLPIISTCINSIQLPVDSAYKCDSTKYSCEVKCNPGYSFPRGEKEIYIHCANGKWILKNSNYLELPLCKPVCNPPCQNNGICKKPGLCGCSPNYFGSYCENVIGLCSSRPYLSKNSKTSCTRNRCNIECQTGFKFEDGTNSATLECLGGQWKNAKTKQLSVADCKPTCIPACKNGGRCISLNTCQCLKHFKGPICQYDINVCNITNTGFNGNIQCSSNNEATICSLKCPEPSKFNIACAGQYKCLYSSGEFFPKPIPKCILPPGSSFLSNSKTSYLQYSSKLIGYNQNYVMKSSRQQTNTGSMSISWNENAANSDHMQTIEQISLNWNKYQREFWKNGGMYLNWNEAQQELNRLGSYKEQKEMTYEDYFDILTSYSLYITSRASVGSVSPKAGVCVTWSGNNVKTFDGSIFKYSLACAHTLVEDRIDGSFHIILQGCLKTSTKCYHSLVIYWQGVEYAFENKDGDIELRTPRKQLQIPIQIMGMQVAYINQFLKINIDAVGILILWDLKHYISIDASAEMWNKTSGLCGTLDSVKENDFLSNDGQIVVKSVKEFVDIWRVNTNKYNASCINENISTNNMKYKTTDITEKWAKIKCNKLLSSLKILECLNFYNKTILTAACIREYIYCPSSNSSCVCEFMEMLIKTCLSEGVKMSSGWRDTDICPIKCKKDRVYKTCGPTVEPTCGNNPTGIDINICNEGCFCPKGQVQYKSKCISIELCPCSLRNKEFQNGSVIQKDCNSCVCKSGIWKCSKNVCDARCSAIGGLHFETFDGKKYDFIGECSYFLLKTENVSIIAESFPFCNSLSDHPKKRAIYPSSSLCLTSIVINTKIDNKLVSIKLEEEQIVYINKKEILKYPQILNNGLLIIRQASSTVVKVDIGKDIIVWWDSTSNIYIDISPKLRNKTYGLCGTFNNNIQDDFLTPEGDTEANVDAFANKWRILDCNNLISSNIQSSKSTLHACQQNPQNKELAENFCNWIINATFEGCHWTVDPEPYYEDCLFDVCNCKTDFALCYCPILSAYGTACSRQGITTKWRSSVGKCDIKCPARQEYDECGNSCLRSCNDLYRKSLCIANCVDGCRCPPGEYLNEKNECITENLCPCFFNGSNFHIGYKEVRPNFSGKLLELCNCVDGSWNCSNAELGDEEKYPAAAQLKNKCKNLQFAEFVECAPFEIKTCMNVDTYIPNYENCKPGCVCTMGYIFDSTTEKCVRPLNCSCYHGGKQYQYSDEIMDDCNKCQCIAGNWECTKNKCASTCSVWGDSHFTTFDKRHFDFQGACDYILSQGYDNNRNGFTITIQNVVCGSLGVTCSKSVKININGKSNTTLTLSSNLQGSSKKQEIHSNGSVIIYKAGVFIVIEDIYIGIQIKWDHGTRVYLKLQNTWKNKVSGLCGNYNDDAQDDMKSPSFGIETSALSFGHSWKVLDYCTIPSEQIDACKEHPQRLTWAQRQCGIIKSEVFQDCHHHVPFEIYLRRCIFDTCACDQGGDCDCLCTAISAYAYACSVQGIFIKWRTPQLCPMQCDSIYSHYSSCTSACPLPTCNNFLEQNMGSLMCHDEQCLEGCAIKGCEKDLIYKDENYMECIPKHTCKPVCLQTGDGVIFYEGDIIRSDKCQTCYCSKKKEVCSGAPCSSFITNMHLSELTSQSPETDYFSTINVNNVSEDCNAEEMEYKEFPNNCYKFLHCQPQINGIWKYVEKTCGPFTMFNPIFNICDHISNVKKIKTSCDSPININLGTKEITSKYPEGYFSNLTKQTTYKPESSIEIEKFMKNCNTANKEYSEFPENCHKFFHCQQEINGSWSFIEKSCGPHMMFNPNGNICDHPTNVEKIKPACKKSELASTMMTTENTRTEEMQIHKCNDGYIWSDCTYHCDHTCHFYKHILIKNGYCNYTSICKSGCVHPQSINCLRNGKLWRDVDSCVSIDECPCMDGNGELIKPHAMYQTIKNGKCKKCQCIDNSVACNDCEHDYNTTLKYIEDWEEHIPWISTDLPLIMTTSVTPPIKCNIGSYVPIINGIEKLPDNIFSASSVLSPFFLPHYARFNSKPTNESNGSWSPLINDQMQYLQVYLPYLQPIYAIIIQGSPISDQYVTLFKILYSIDGEAYHYLIDESGGPQIFSGPVNAKSSVKSFFKIPIEALVLRIYPLKWHGSISIRLELFGCDNSMTEEKATSHINFYTDLQAVSVIETDYENNPICYNVSEIQIGVIPTNYVTASSVWPRIINGKKPALVDMLRKSSLIGWRPALDSPNEFISFDFKKPTNLTGVRTFGGVDGWVTAFNIFYSIDGQIWNKILNSDGLAKIFIGNHDRNTAKMNYFKYPVRTQHLKIIPIKWQNTINMRIEALGCLEQDTIKQETINLVETSKICLTCPDVDNILTISDVDKCKCFAPLFWDGDKCVEKNDCSCVDNHIKYAVGVKFENKECMNCICVLGGIQQCKAKLCPPCKSGLRQLPSKSCLCICESCPEFQKLCPSSGDCIPESLWCNGVKDCEDDENEECSEYMNVIQNNIILNITKECSQPSCPSGMEIMFISNSETKLSSMFQSQITNQYFDDKHPMINNNIQQYIITTPNPNLNVEIAEENNCIEFVCKPKQYSTFKEKIECNNFKCPENYEIQTNFDDMLSNNCPTFTCKRRPIPDDICYIIGNIFKTFDGTEYKYEVCSHTLARDISQNNWEIRLYRNCASGDACTKEIKIEDKVSNIVLSIQHNLKVILHGYQYSANQLQNSNLISAAFIISQPGETILIVSIKHGFWVSFNTKNEIKIGVSSKFINTVDGLCGYYNGRQIDDKRLPNGDLADSTFKFGESWSTKEADCPSWVCPNDTQKNALTLCMSIKNDSLLIPCAKTLNFNQFIPTCVEKMCECFKSEKNQENTLSKHCKCLLLQSFVTDCLSINPDFELETWKYIYKCEITCTPPLVYRDCYKKRCEKSCDSTQHCPVLPNACFSGCFCPEGTVKKNNHCLPITECKNCVCTNFGLANFITFHNQNLTLKRNCNYLVSRTKKMTGDHHFQIFGSYECKTPEFELTARNCFNVLHFMSSKNVVTLKTYTNGSRKFLVNGEEIQTSNSFKNSFISTEIYNENFVMNMIEDQVEILSRFNDLSFSIRVSNLKYQGQLEGICGNCGGQLDNNTLVNTNNTELVKNFKSEMNLKLKIHERELNLDNIHCQMENTSTKTCVLPEKNSCLKLLDKNIFGQCHNLVDPALYISTCQQNLCSKQSACASISAYARECLNNGVCVDWRKPDFCPYECPSNLQYNACGCGKTCAHLLMNNIFDVISIATNTTIKSKKQIKCPGKTFEGCFCSKGKLLHGNKCILEKECIRCGGVKHYYGEIWRTDKCTECQCNSQGEVECTKKVCQIEETICEKGFRKESKNNEEDCCRTFFCVPHHSTNSSGICPKLSLPECGPRQQIIETIDLNGCSKYICECSSSLACTENSIKHTLSPGEKLITELVNCCPVNKIVCDHVLCPSKPLKCENEFHELIKTSKDNVCCPVYECVLSQNVCLVEINKKPIIKQLGEKWNSSDPCSYNVCASGLNGKASNMQQAEICSNTECDKDSTYIVDRGQCCGKCVQTMCEYEERVYNPGDKWLSADNCTSFLCIKKDNKTIVSSSVETCPNINDCPEDMKIQKDCCIICQTASAPSRNCIAIKVPEVETIGLVEIFKKGHGVCINKEPISGFLECSGNCPSGTKYKKEINKFKTYCDCCFVEKYQKVNTTLICSDGFHLSEKVEVPLICGCKPCMKLL